MELISITRNNGDTDITLRVSKQEERELIAKIYGFTREPEKLQVELVPVGTPDALLFSNEQAEVVAKSVLEQHAKDPETKLPAVPKKERYQKYDWRKVMDSCHDIIANSGRPLNSSEIYRLLGKEWKPTPSLPSLIDYMLNDERFSRDQANKWAIRKRMKFPGEPKRGQIEVIEITKKDENMLSGRKR